MNALTSKITLLNSIPLTCHPQMSLFAHGSRLPPDTHSPLPSPQLMFSQPVHPCSHVDRIISPFPVSKVDDLSGCFSSPLLSPLSFHSIVHPPPPPRPTFQLSSAEEEDPWKSRLECCLTGRNAAGNEGRPFATLFSSSLTNPGHSVSPRQKPPNKPKQCTSSGTLKQPKKTVGGTRHSHFAFLGLQHPHYPLICCKKPGLQLPSISHW